MADIIAVLCYYYYNEHAHTIKSQNDNWSAHDSIVCTVMSFSVRGPGFASTVMYVHIGLL